MNAQDNVIMLRKTQEYAFLQAKNPATVLPF